MATCKIFEAAQAQQILLPITNMDDLLLTVFTKPILYFLHTRMYKHVLINELYTLCLQTKIITNQNNKFVDCSALMAGSDKEVELMWLSPENRKISKNYNIFL
ncbi:hypothetical protein ACJX0J_027781 [Zea mays]